MDYCRTVQFPGQGKLRSEYVLLSRFIAALDPSVQADFAYSAGGALQISRQSFNPTRGLLFRCTRDAIRNREQWRKIVLKVPIRRTNRSRRCRCRQCVVRRLVRRSSKPSSQVRVKQRILKVCVAVDKRNFWCVHF